jgi:hypothetical protein
LMGAQFTVAKDEESVAYAAERLVLDE